MGTARAVKTELDELNELLENALAQLSKFSEAYSEIFSTSEWEKFSLQLRLLYRYLEKTFIGRIKNVTPDHLIYILVLLLSEKFKDQLPLVTSQIDYLFNHFVELSSGKLSVVSENATHQAITTLHSAVELMTLKVTAEEQTVIDGMKKTVAPIILDLRVKPALLQDNREEIEIRCGFLTSNHQEANELATHLCTIVEEKNVDSAIKAYIQLGAWIRKKIITSGFTLKQFKNNLGLALFGTVLADSNVIELNQLIDKAIALFVLNVIPERIILNDAIHSAIYQFKQNKDDKGELLANQLQQKADHFFDQPTKQTSSALRNFFAVLIDEINSLKTKFASAQSGLAEELTIVREKIIIQDAALKTARGELGAAIRAQKETKQIENKVDTLEQEIKPSYEKRNRLLRTQQDFSLEEKRIIVIQRLQNQVSHLQGFFGRHPLLKKTLIGALVGIFIVSGILIIAGTAGAGLPGVLSAAGLAIGHGFGFGGAFAATSFGVTTMGVSTVGVCSLVPIIPNGVRALVRKAKGFGNWISNRFNKNKKEQSELNQPFLDEHPSLSERRPSINRLNNLSDDSTKMVFETFPPATKNAKSRPHNFSRSVSQGIEKTSTPRVVVTVAEHPIKSHQITCSLK